MIMMLKRTGLFLAILVSILSCSERAYALRGKPKPPLYGERYCGQAGFHCLTIGKDRVEEESLTEGGVEIKVRETGRPTWEKLWPDQREREIVMRLNRMNIRLENGMRIAAPDDMDGKTFMDFSPFPRERKPECEPTGEEVCRLECANNEGGEISCKTVCEQSCRIKGEYTCLADGTVVTEKLLIVDLAQMAFAAYDERGILLRWGPVAGGRDWGNWVNPENLTVVGEFKISRKYGRWAKSALYPRATKDKPAGGALVPYFMRFSPGYGLHAYHTVPGRHASHGCVRLFFEDAKWLNTEFAEIGTRVIVLPYEE